MIDRIRPLKRLLRAAGVLSPQHMNEWPRDIMRHDVRKGLPFPSSSVSTVYSEHMLEHLYLEEALTLLSEVRRVLRPDGVLRLALPDCEALATAFLRDLASGDPEAGRRFNEGLCAHPIQPPTRYQRLRSLLASPPHRWQPSRSLIGSMLSKADFAQVTYTQFRMGSVPDLDLLEHREDSLFVEASP